MNTHTIHKIAFSLILGGTLSVASNLIMAATTTPGITISQIPLSTGATGVVPNIMLMVDNSGSMSTSFNVLGTAITPSGMPTNFSYTCNTKVAGGASTATTATTPIYMDVSGTSVPSTPTFCTSATGTCSTVANFGTSKCFDNTLYYNVVNFDNNSSLGNNSGILGKNLNWYFSTGKFAPGSLVASSTTSSTTRTGMAKAAATALVNSLIPLPNENSTVRMGFTSYYSGLLVPINDIKNVNGVTTQADLIKAQIAAIGTPNDTPLSQTLADIGRYYAGTGVKRSVEDNIQLTLHPGASNQQVAAISDIFWVHSFLDFSTSNYTSTSTTYNNGVRDGLTTPPIQSYCQRSAVILISDGLPNGDQSSERDISPYLRDYTGDCAVKGLCDSTPNSLSLPGASGVPLTATGTGCHNAVAQKTKNGVITTPAQPADWYNKACQNGTKAGRVYETGGSDYLDDVAQALYDMDLRPTWPGITKPTGSKNNVKTYAIGIADPSVSADSVLRDAANVGGGTFAYADNLQALTAALDKMVAAIQTGVGSFSAIAANSSQLGTGSALFQAKYDTTDWTGDFIALPLATGTGQVLNPVWDAGEKIPAYQSRNIYTYSSTTNGIPFSCSRLTTTQLTALGISSCSSTTDQGVWLLNFLRGDISHELVNTVHSAAYNSTANPNPDPRAVNTAPVFRNRARFWDANAIAPIKEGDLRKPDPWLLGDIVNSDPVYVSNETYGYDTLSATKAAEGSTYNAFVTNNSNRSKMAYVGANDGMLHGFNASISSADISSGAAGKEILAYIPNAVFANLPSLSSPDYGHLYYVDGSPSVSDVYFGSAWHTVLVGTTGAGGKSVFALDVTNPSTFNNTNVLWEVSNIDAPVASNLTTDTTTLRGFKNNLGYTLPQASIGKMHDGSWAAIVANGYASANNWGVLYIINIQTGAIIAALDTKVSSAGLSTPFAADVDLDGVIDAVYAGDLLGNMWKFDLSSKDPTQWNIAYGTSSAPAPLYTACNNATSVTTCDSSRQPITNKPQVGKVGSTQTATGGVMVYFGTGKYFEDIDNNVTNTQTQTFYGVWDKCLLDYKSDGVTANPNIVASNCTSTVPKTSLVQQSIIAQLAPSVAVPMDVRVTSNNTIDYTSKNGWYIDFVNPNTNANEGERIVSASLLRGGRIIFATLIPVPPTVSTDPNALCTAGSKSTSWLTELDAISGSRTSTPTLDINKNGLVSSTDTVTVSVMVNGVSQNIDVPASGIKMTNGSTKTPAVMSNPGGDELKFTGSSNGTAPSSIAESAPKTTNSGASRQSWRQVIQ